MSDLNPSPLIQQLIQALCCLPGIGPKSAQRIAMHLLEKQREKALSLSKSLEEAATQVGACLRCRTLTELSICRLCANTQRNAKLLCIVETPSDIMAIERTHSFKGYYFVLRGRLSPLDGMGPDELGIDQLKTRIETEPVEEIILATNPTIEGEATAHYIAEQLKPFSVRLTRLAHGVPIGGELEYLDAGTVIRALAARVEVIHYETA